MHIQKSMSLFMLAFTMGAAHAASAYPEYRITIVAPAGSQALSINSAGVVVGNYPFRANITHGFLNRGRGLVDLGTLGGAASNAVAINDYGQVLGHWTTRTGQQRGYLYARGQQRDLGVIRGRQTTYTDINNVGYITAFASEAVYLDGVRSYLRAPNGTLKDIGHLPFPKPNLTFAYTLNNRNQIAGASGEATVPDQPLSAFRSTGGVLQNLGDFGWGPNYAYDINARGQVTGAMSVPAGYRDTVAFLYSNGRLISIEPGTHVPFTSSVGTGINSHGHIVGASDAYSGFIYRGKRMESLNALIDPKLGWDIGSPQAINDAGQIAATAPSVKIVVASSDLEF